MRSVLLFLLLVCGPGAILSDAHANAPVRVMLVGDSLTENQPGYRESLYQKLKENGYSVRFVGPKNGRAADGGQMDHAGFGGFSIGPGPSIADQWTDGKGNIDANIETCLASDPQIVFLLIGINEYFNVQKFQPTLDPNRDGPQRLAALVDHIHAVKPEVKVLVSSLLPVGWSADFTKGFNDALPSLLKDKPNTVFADTASLVKFQTGDWSPDNLHPSEAGYQKIAEAFYEVLKTYLPKN